MASSGCGDAAGIVYERSRNTMRLPQRVPAAGSVCFSRWAALCDSAQSFHVLKTPCSHKYHPKQKRIVPRMNQKARTY